MPHQDVSVSVGVDDVLQGFSYEDAVQHDSYETSTDFLDDILSHVSYVDRVGRGATRTEAENMGAKVNELYQILADP